MLTRLRTILLETSDIILYFVKMLHSYLIFHLLSDTIREKQVRKKAVMR